MSVVTSWIGGADEAAIQARIGSSAAATATTMIASPLSRRPGRRIAGIANATATSANGTAPRNRPSPTPLGTRPDRARSGPRTAAATAPAAQTAAFVTPLWAAGCPWDVAGSAGRSVTSRGLLRAEQLLPAVGRLHGGADAA